MEYDNQRIKEAARFNNKQRSDVFVHANEAYSVVISCYLTAQLSVRDENICTTHMTCKRHSSWVVSQTPASCCL